MGPCFHLLNRTYISTTEEKRKIDFLFDGKEFFALEKEEVRKKVHGTGCFFSSRLLQERNPEAKIQP